MWKGNAEGIEGESPYYELKELITFIKNLKSNERKFELKGYKTCSLMSTTITEEENGNCIITGVFKSAQYQYRPNFWDTKTDEERPSPKKLSEGEKEKTHFAIKIVPNDDVYFVLEINGNGITINNIVLSYLPEFNKRLLKSTGKKQNFSIHYSKVGRGDFLQELEKLSRTRIVEVHFDKSLLGGNGLNFSGRTMSLQRDVLLTLKAEKKQSVTETAIDIFNKFNTKDATKSISRIRIQGKDSDNEDTILDTSFMEKLEYATVSLNPTTGEVQTTEMLSFLKSYLNSL
jgi:hypothetical protein